MVEQGDGVHAWPEEPPVLPGGGHWGDMENFVFEENMEILEHLERANDPEQFNNNDNIVQINFDNFLNADNENDDRADNYNFNDDNQNADSSNDEEDNYDSDQDENALAGAEVNQAAGEAQGDSLLGGSWRWFIEEDGEAERRHARKHFDWWDEFATSSSDEEDSLLEGDRGNDENGGQEW